MTQTGGTLQSAMTQAFLPLAAQPQDTSTSHTQTAAAEVQASAVQADEHVQTAEMPATQLAAAAGLTPSLLAADLADLATAQAAELASARQAMQLVVNILAPAVSETQSMDTGAQTSRTYTVPDPAAQSARTARRVAGVQTSVSNGYMATATLSEAAAFEPTKTTEAAVQAAPAQSHVTSSAAQASAQVRLLYSSCMCIIRQICNGAHQLSSSQCR